MKVPKGWRLVPVEPTEAMLQAPKMREYAWVSGEAVEGWDIARCWEEMLSAAPEPPTDEKDGSNEG